MGSVKSIPHTEDEEEKSSELPKQIINHPFPRKTNSSWGRKDQEEEEELSHFLDRLSFLKKEDKTIESRSPIVNPITPDLIYSSLCYILTEIKFPNSKTPKALGPATRELEEYVSLDDLKFWCGIVADQLMSGSKTITSHEGLFKLENDYLVNIQQRMINDLWEYAITPFDRKNKVQSVEEQKAMLNKIREGK